jgi:hypothetical protein
MEDVCTITIREMQANVTSGRTVELESHECHALPSARGRSHTGERKCADVDTAHNAAVPLRGTTREHESCVPPET